jgi:polar amino acid transport system substrate-binding protein
MSQSVSRKTGAWSPGVFMDGAFVQLLERTCPVWFSRAWVAGLGLVFAALLCFPQPGSCGPILDRVMKSGVLRVGLPFNVIPQGFLKPEGEWTGFEVDLGADMAKHMNLKLEAVKVNDKTWRSMLAAGHIDAALCRIRHTRSLESEFDFSEPYFFDSLHVMAVKGAMKTPADLKGQKIAAVQGSSSERAAMRLLREAGDPNAQKNVVSFPDRSSCFAALGQEKVAGWLDSGMLLLEYASGSPGRFELLPVTEQLEPVAVALPQNDSAWRDLINFTIQDMAADGSLGKIYNKWFGPDTPHAFPLRRAIDVWQP